MRQNDGEQFGSKSRGQFGSTARGSGYTKKPWVKRVTEVFDKAGRKMGEIDRWVSANEEISELFSPTLWHEAVAVCLIKFDGETVTGAEHVLVNEPATGGLGEYLEGLRPMVSMMMGMENPPDASTWSEIKKFVGTMFSETR